MRRALHTSACLFLVLLPVYGQELVWDRLMRESSEAYNRKEHTTAVKKAYEALRFAEGEDKENQIKAAKTLYLLGEINIDLGHIDEAITCARKAFLIRSNVLGNEAMDTAISANSLAQLYQEAGEYEKAVPLNEQAILIWQRELGVDHPNISVPLNNQGKIFYIAGLYFKQQAEKVSDLEEQKSLKKESEVNLKKSVAHFLSAMKILNKHGGEADPNLGACQQNLGDVYYTIGDMARAEQMYRSGLKNLGKALGPTNPHVVKCMTNLASTCFKQDKNEEAEKYYQAALKYTAQSPIKGHKAHVLELSQKMAAFYESIGNREKAAACKAQVVMLLEDIEDSKAHQRQIQ